MVAVWAARVGVGGIDVEPLKDVSVRMLPVGRAEVRAMLDELQYKALLQGARGSKPADMEALTEALLPEFPDIEVSARTHLSGFSIPPCAWLDAVPAGTGCALHPLQVPTAVPLDKARSQPSATMKSRSS